MCELFALSARHATNVRLSFEELHRHGGGTGPHSDGWGVAYFHGPDLQRIREPEPAASSPLAEYVRRADFRSGLILSHIRRATMGHTSLANTHPFTRELGGRMHAFAHNGHLPGIDELGAVGRFRPLGDTDSERAFCLLLARLAPLWCDGPPPPEDRIAVVHDFAEQLRALGVANFLYADGELLFAHGHRRAREHDDDPVEPGLHVLHRHCDVDLDGTAGVAVARCDAPQAVVLVATVPLSDEGWTALSPHGELLVARAGERVQ